VNTTTIHVTGSADLKGLKFDLGSADLGNSKGFNFFVESIDGDGSAGHIDDGPSGSGSWQYKLQSPLAVALASHCLPGRRKMASRPGAPPDTGAILAEGRSRAARPGLDEAAQSTCALPLRGLASAAVCEFKVPKLKHKLLHGTRRSPSRA
jgi:hypothetical protein